jgi:2'-5' RNA ligase
MRTFVAIEIPQEIRVKIHALGGKIPGRLSRMAIDNIHITLLFLGDINSEQLAKVQRAIATINVKPFSIAIKGISYFGGREMHTIFANVTDDGQTKAVYLELSELLLSFGIKVEHSREYIPHVTIARVKEGNADTREFIGRNSGQEFGEFNVSAICIKQSVLSEKGPVYTTLFERKLA